MTPKAIELTGLWALVAGGFADVNFADVDMAWLAAFSAFLWTVKLFGVWLYGLVRKWRGERER